MTTFKWCGKYKYDFYFEYDNEQYIVETHGGQHYRDNTKFRRNYSKIGIKENDKLKKELALENEIKEENYIVIDCRYSELDWIKNNKNGILNSRLAELFDLSKIDWFKVDKFACSNLIKNLCEYWMNNQNITIVETGKKFGHADATIRRWLKYGNKFGWCTYIPKKLNKKL